MLVCDNIIAPHGHEKCDIFLLVIVSNEMKALSSPQSEQSPHHSYSDSSDPQSGVDLSGDECEK